ncbi:uncharacterized protein LOC111694644 [Trichogramma pretiosum]|uniref:uncharacterized protein LOC111694644 n=1 Tax=Trichogramma pretiosum TaxID=7493 RepID=UPI000C718A39|nr:uncharacterized protein LOC111694644 [Trichogramma pretiosum]
MESSNVLNPTVRVKKEPRDEPLNDDNDYEITDITSTVTQNVKYERFWQENSTQELLQECDENHEKELGDVQIGLECTDMKPNLFAIHDFYIKKTNRIYSYTQQNRGT